VPAAPKWQDIQISDSNLAVTWTSTFNCDGTLPYVVKFRIYWCKADLSKHCSGTCV